MIIVAWATQQPTRTLVASAQPGAPVVDDEPNALASLLRRLTRRA
jgi:hypothetical protein